MTEVQQSAQHTYRIMLPKLSLIDISATVGCNLNCKGCNHFSNYFAPGSKIDTDQLIKDIHTILPRVSLDRVSIIGGEPLLNPRCRELVHACLEHDHPVYLYSNGILLEQNMDWIMEDLENNPSMRLRISVHIDEVVPIVNKIRTDQLVTTDHRQGKDQWFTSIKHTNDGKVHPYKHNDPERSFKECSCPNTQLWKGKLWKCPNSAFLEQLLYATDQSDDEEWQRYLGGGLPVDCSDEELAEFCDNNLKAEDICNMCTARPLYMSAAMQSTKKNKIVF